MSIKHMNIPEELVLSNELSCAICHNFLSVPPVTHFRSVGFVCGRCADKVQDLPRVTIYETVAQVLKFPCRFKSEGCKKYLRWGTVQEHEETCVNKYFDCPSTPLYVCKWKGTVENMVTHFSQNHKELMMNWTFFHLPRKHSGQVNKLMVHKDMVFLFQSSLAADLKICWLGLRYIGDITNLNYTFNVTLRADNSTNVVLKDKKITGLGQWTCDLDNMVPIKIETFKSMFDSSNIMCKLELEEIIKAPPVQVSQVPPVPAVSTKVKADNQLLEELECPICKEYMSAPIYICRNGHSICGNCKLILPRCPSCQVELLDTRNFTLEKMSALMQFPCRNDFQGCKFSGNLQAVKSHEKSCLMQNFACPCAEQFSCKFFAGINAVYDHVKAKHPGSTAIQLNLPCFRNLESKVFSDNHLIKHDNNIFQFYCKHTASSNGPVLWAVRHLNLKANDNPRYKYQLEFVDQTNKGRVLIVNELCYFYANFGKGNPPHCLDISRALLQPFINADKLLIFKLKIEKI